MSYSHETAARTLYGEARGEPEEGRRAVAHVFVNRYRDGRWGGSLGEVCQWPAQFAQSKFNTIERFRRPRKPFPCWGD